MTRPKPPPCSFCQGRGWHIGECVPREVCADCSGSGLVLKAGDVVFTYLLGTVKLVREMRGQSGVDGWQVERENGTLTYLDYVDFSLTELEVNAIRSALTRARDEAAERSSRG